MKIPLLSGKASARPDVVTWRGKIVYYTLILTELLEGKALEHGGNGHDVETYGIWLRGDLDSGLVGFS